MKRKYLILFSLSGLVLCADQWIKEWAHLFIEQNSPHTLIPGVLDLVVSRNTGFAFGLLHRMPPALQSIFFVGVPTFALILIILIFIKLQDNQVMTSLALTIILGGAVGNLIDRLHRGHVIDLFSLRLFSWRLPSFNVADTAIVLGVILMFLGTFRQPRAHAN